MNKNNILCNIFHRMAKYCAYKDIRESPGSVLIQTVRFDKNSFHSAKNTIGIYPYLLKKDYRSPIFDSPKHKLSNIDNLKAI